MSVSRRRTSVAQRKARVPVLAAVMLAGYLAASPVHSATFGHSRLVSEVGEPLRITIPVTQLSAAEAESLQVVPAPASAWVNAGLTPPVDPATLQTRLTDGYAPGARVIQVWSDQVFSQSIADLLLDIQTSSGTQRYQVSLLAWGGAAAVQAPVAAPAASSSSSSATTRQTDIIAQAPVLVRRGDTMFSVARRHAVSGVTVYQMMMALQRANPKAFIHHNINLIKAGERLVMPDMDALTAISDREARRLFHEQVVAFNAYRQGQGDLIAGDLAPGQGITQTDQDLAEAQGVSNIPESRIEGGDQLKLSGGRTAVTSVAGSSPADTDSQATSHVDQQTGSSSTNSILEAQTAASGIGKAVYAASATGSPDATSDSSASIAVGGASLAGSDSVAPSMNGASGSGSAATGTASGGQTSVGDGSATDDAVASRKAIEDAEMRVSMLEENVKNLNQALQSQGEAAIDVVVDGAIGLRKSLTDVATAVTDATIGDDDFLDDPAPAQTGTETTSKNPQDNATTSMMESFVTWMHANFIGAVIAVLALIVLIIAWVLRRANIAQSRSESAVTPEMVKEKLDSINLDLNEPTVGDNTRRS